MRHTNFKSAPTNREFSKVVKYTQIKTNNLFDRNKTNSEFIFGSDINSSKYNNQFID